MNKVKPYTGLFLLSLLIFFNCTSKKSEVKLELLNDEVHYVNLDSLTLNNVRGDYLENEKKLAKNIITFKITNNTDKKYLFTINPNNLINFSFNSIGVKSKNELKDNSSGFIYFDLKDNKGKAIFSKVGSNYKPKMGQEKALMLLKNKNLIRKVEEKKFNELGNKVDYIIYNNFIDKSFVLSSGDSKTIKILLYLPIITETNNELDNFFEILYLDKLKKYSFKLLFFNDKSVVEGLLQDYQKKELKENGVEIFHGKLVSNEVPVKMVRMAE